MHATVVFHRLQDDFLSSDERVQKKKFDDCHGNVSDLQTTMDAQSVSRIQDLAPTPCLSYCNHLRCYSIRQGTEDGGTDQG